MVVVHFVTQVLPWRVALLGLQWWQVVLQVVAQPEGMPVMQALLWWVMVVLQGFRWLVVAAVWALPVDGMSRGRI